MEIVAVIGEPGVGKTALCVGLGQIWKKDGISVGYFKPRKSTQESDRDGAFLSKVLELDSSLESITPIGSSDVSQQLDKAFAKASEGKDVVLVEQTGQPGQPQSQFLRQRNVRLLLVLRYRQDLRTAITDWQTEAVNDMLAGVVVNFVPSDKVDALKNELKALSESLSIPLMGLLPEDPALLGVELNELVTTLEGTYLTAPESATEMVEKIAVIPVSIDVSPPFFESHHHTALITRGDRPDLQLTALNGPGLCLVLTRAEEVNPSVLYRAEEMNRPIVTSPLDTATSLDRVNKAFAEARFNQEFKMPMLIESMSAHLDIDSFSAALGLST